MEIGKIFRNARKVMGLTLVDLAKKVDTDSGNLSRFETGKQGMSSDLMLRVMMELNISFSGPGVAGDGAIDYPLLKWKDLKGFLETGEEISVTLRSSEKAGEGAFWVEVITDQMMSDHAPSFVEGSRILIDRRATELENGDLYLFYLPTPGEYLFRQYVGHKDSQFLRPLRAIYLPVQMPFDAIVVGKVVDSKQPL